MQFRSFVSVKFEPIYKLSDLRFGKYQRFQFLVTDYSKFTCQTFKTSDILI